MTSKKTYRIAMSRTVTEHTYVTVTASDFETARLRALRLARGKIAGEDREHVGLWCDPTRARYRTGRAEVLPELPE